MNLSNKTRNFSNFPFLPLFTYEPVVFFVFSNLPKYIMSFGIIGNVISLFIFYRPCLNRKTNSGRLYALLCWLNLIILIYNLAGRTLDIPFAFKFHLPRYTEFFINIILLQYWSWIQVFITFDRFIGVFYPIKGVRIMGKKWVLYSILFGMLILILVVNSPNYIRCSTYMVGNETFKANDMMPNDVVVLTGIVRSLMQFVIPYLLMIIVDVMVIVRLRRFKTAVGERQSNINCRSLRFSRNTILIDFIYLIFNLPPTIINAYAAFLSINPKMNVFYLYFYTASIFEIFPYIYPSILFLVFITFNRIFRSEFIEIALKCFNEIKKILFYK